MIGIYKITNTITNDSYIGRSIDVEKRYRQHIAKSYIYRYEKKIHPLYFDMNKIGADKFILQILETLSEDYQRYKLNQLEFEYMCDNKTNYNKQPPIFDEQWSRVASIDKIYIKIGKYEFSNTGYLQKIEYIRNSEEYAHKLCLIDLWREKAKMITKTNFNKKINKKCILEINKLLGINDLYDLKLK